MPAPVPHGEIVLAAITRPHGLQGAVRAKVFNPETEVLVPGRRLTLRPSEGDAREVVVLGAQPGRETWILRLAGVATFDAAVGLRGATLTIARDALPQAEAGEYYHHDLPGCEVRDATGRVVGRVREVVRYPSVDALVVATERDPVEIPVVDGIVTSIDVATRIIIVDMEALEPS
jgi:16S rRNA processing protein RimM